MVPEHQWCCDFPAVFREPTQVGYLWQPEHPSCSRDRNYKCFPGVLMDCSGNMAREGVQECAHQRFQICQLISTGVPTGLKEGHGQQVSSYAQL